MKRISVFTGFIIVLLFGATFYFSGCVHDACVARNVQCNNGGTCREGDCICPSGYEGDSCQFRVNEKFAGNYKCIRTGFIDDTIPDDNDDTLIVRANNDKFGITFFSIRDSIYYVVKGTTNGNFITIPEQDLIIVDTVTVKGTGSLNGEVITLTVYNNWKDLLDNPHKSKITYAGTRYEGN